MGLGDNEVTLELWQAQRTKVGKLRLDHVYAETQYAEPTMVLQFRGSTWDRHDVPATTVLDLWAEVCCRGAGSEELRLGRADAKGSAPYVAPERHPDVHNVVTLALPLGHEGLYAVNRACPIGDLLLELVLHGVASVETQRSVHADDVEMLLEVPAPADETPPKPLVVVPSPMALWGDGRIRIARSAWAEMLEHWHFGTHWLVDLTATHSEIRVELQQAIERLRSAQRQLLTAKAIEDYAHAVTSCRKALDQVAKAFGAVEADKDAGTKIMSGVADPAIRAALSAAFKATKDLTNLGPHDEDQATPTPPRLFTRNQAEYVLHLTLAAIALAGRP